MLFWTKIKLVAMVTAAILLVGGAGVATYVVAAGDPASQPAAIHPTLPSKPVVQDGPQVTVTPPQAAIGDKPASTRPAPVAITYKDVRGGKPPMRFYHVGMDVTNDHDYAVWFVMPYSGDKPLPVTNRIVAGVGDYMVFGPYDFTKNAAPAPSTAPATKILSFECIGRFLAWRMPPHGKLNLDQHVIETWAPIEQYTVWEVSDILINDKTPLEDWIATRLLAPEGHYATLTEANRNPRAANEIQHGAKQETVDVVNSVKFGVQGRWTISIHDLPQPVPDPWR